jgi:hypothetical protein
MPIISARTDKRYLPFPTALEGTPLPPLPAVDANADPCVPCPVAYVKNPNGRYIFANNPEMLAPPDLNVCNISTQRMAGEYYFTFENSNHTGQSLYMGYRLYNKGDDDLVVTVKNIGYQCEGEWLGARSWSDFYNLKFPRPADYVGADGREAWYYRGQDFLDYTPRVWIPETYTVPPGQYMWILGGTTADNYGSVNVAGTADRLVPPGRCMNGVVLFDVVRGENVDGSLWFYTDASLLDEYAPQQGDVTFRDGKSYARQYKGTDPCHGLIEAGFAWTVNDSTPPGRLPVKYTVSYDDTAYENFEPFRVYGSKTYPKVTDKWYNGLNPHGFRDGVGTDMTEFHCVDGDGNPVVYDCLRADATGKPGNFGNWMITYQENYTFYNTGQSPRTFSLHVKGMQVGTLAVLLRDAEGNVTDSLLQCHPLTCDRLLDFMEADKYVVRDNPQPDWIKGIFPVTRTYWPVIDGVPYYDLVEARAKVAEIAVAPQSVERVTLEYVLLGNSSGGMVHWAEVG